MPSIEEGMEHMELESADGVTQTAENHFADRLAASTRAEHMHSLWSRNALLGIIHPTAMNASVH